MQTRTMTDCNHNNRSSEFNYEVDHQSAIAIAIAIEVPKIEEPKIEEPKIEEPAPLATATATPTADNVTPRTSPARMRHKSRGSRRKLQIQQMSAVATSTMQTSAESNNNNNNNNNSPRKPSPSAVNPLTVTAEPPQPTIKEQKWTGEAEEDATIARRQAIQTIMKDTALTGQERSRKIQDLMNTTTSTGRSSPVPPAAAADEDKPASEQPQVKEQKWTGEAEEDATIAKRKAIQTLMKDTSLSAEERRKGIQDLMNSAKTPSPVGGGPDEVKPSSIKGPNTRLQRKMSRGTTPISAGMAATTYTTEPLQEPSSDDSDIKPGFTAVRGGDSRISRKMSRGTITADALPVDLRTTPQADEDEPIRPGISPARSRSGSRRKLRGSMRSSSPGIAGAGVRASFTSPATASLKIDTIEPEEPAATLPGAVSARNDSRVARKVRASMTTATAAASLKIDTVAPEEPAAVMPGTVTSMSGDSRVARKLRASSGGPGAVAASYDSQVQRKMSANRGTTVVASGLAAAVTESFEDEPEGPPLPGTAVSSYSNSRFARKIAQAQSGVGASAQTDDSAVSRKTGRRTRGAAMERAAATAAAGVGAVHTVGDDPAAQKTSFVRDNLFETAEGKEINPDDYLMQQVKATQEAQQKMVSKKKEDKDKLNRGLQKDGVAALPKAPGAFSVKGGRGWFTGGYRQRAARGMLVRFKSGLVQDADVVAVAGDVDEDETWWDRADKPTLIVGACIVVFMIIAISVPVALVQTKVEPPTPAPTSARFFLLDDFQELFSEVSDSDVFNNPQSPQSQALNWFVYEDELELGPTDEAAIQRYICMVTYFGNGGQQWDFPAPAVKWGSGVHHCEWDYITCASNRTVGKLNLFQVGMTGTLEAELLHLPQLTDLDLGRNYLTEVEFPSILLKMTNLMFLYLDELDLEGTIPIEIAALTKLEQLFLSSNDFTGTLPVEMRSMTSMRSFQAPMNRLEGNIFNLVSGWPALKHLEIGNNDFVGTIPTQLPLSLVNLRLERNDFHGSLPTELGELENLKSIVVTQNFLLDGTIPSELAKCTKLQILHLDSNDFHGAVPTELGNLASIRDIRLVQNDFTGLIPSELGLCTTLEQLTLTNNEFENAVPTELGQLTELTELALHFNDVTGSMPPEICALRKANLKDLQADCKFTAVAQLKCDEECCTLCH